MEGEKLAELDRRLARLRETRSDLDAQTIALQGALIRARIEMLEPDLPRLRLPPETAAERLRSHTPLLHQSPAFVDLGWAAGLFGRLVEVATQHSSTDQAETLAAALEEGLLDLESLFQEAFVQHREHVAHIAAEAEVDPDLLSSLAWLAVAPLLAGYARQLQPYLDRGVGDWVRGYCPACGAWPGFVELRGLQRLRWLRCLSCGTGWLAPPACTFCLSQTAVPLGLEGDPRFGIEACDGCQGYLKTVRAFEPSPTEFLGLDDLASVHLDALAYERGYARPTAPGFPLELADDAFPVHPL
jgi:FdhE protein